MKYTFCQTVILFLNKFSFFNSLRKLAKMFGAMAVLGLLPLFFRSGLFVELSLYSVRKSIYHQDSRSSLNQLKSPVYGAFGFKVSPKRGRRQLEKTSCTMLSLSVFGKFLSKRFIFLLGTEYYFSFNSHECHQTLVVNVVKYLQSVLII